LGAKPLSANAYLGAWGIVEALKQGADVVVCLASPTLRSLSDRRLALRLEADDWNKLAGAVVAGHVVECGAQCTGGNYAFFKRCPDSSIPDFQSLRCTRTVPASSPNPGTGGLVSVGTVTAQLLYEIDEPAYRNPDVVARFDTIYLEQEGRDRVRVSVFAASRHRDRQGLLELLGRLSNQMTSF